jgi:hypothetical protein
MFSLQTLPIPPLVTDRGGQRLGKLIRKEGRKVERMNGLQMASISNAAIAASKEAVFTVWVNRGTKTTIGIALTIVRELVLRLGLALTSSTDRTHQRL